MRQNNRFDASLFLRKTTILSKILGTFLYLLPQKMRNFVANIQTMNNKTFNRTLVTAALPYANGGVHIGHLAGVYVPSDIYVRYLRCATRKMLFVCGSDEHGVPVTIRARKEGCTVQEVVDRYQPTHQTVV